MIKYSVVRHKINEVTNDLIRSEREAWYCKSTVFKNGGSVIINRYTKVISVYVPFKETAYITINGITKDNYNIACHIARNCEGWLA